MEKIGTAPVKDCYFALVDEDTALRDFLVSSASSVKIDDDIENLQGIAIEITDDGIKTSKGWKEFFRCKP